MRSSTSGSDQNYSFSDGFGSSISCDKRVFEGYGAVLHLVRHRYGSCIHPDLVITQVLDVGCGEGQLLYALTHSAPWLKPPPPFVLSQNIEAGDSTTQQLPSPSYLDDDIPNLHISELHGLDICEEDLAFAAKGIVPKIESGIDDAPSWTVDLPRWEELTAKVWKGGLQFINEEFVDMECIVSTEV